MYESQKKWAEKNFYQTLKKHGAKIENLMKKISIFDIWSNKLQEIEVARRLIPEIFMDSYISINLACMGLYRYANICLRSQLETVLRLVFFSTHPIEFRWWEMGSEWYRRNKDVWGEGYKYFELLEPVKEFDKNCYKSKRLFKENNKVSGVYHKLSKYVHARALSFQTMPDAFSPRYRREEFERWANSFKEVQRYVNIILVLGFPEKFKDLKKIEQKMIINLGIEDRHYGANLKKTLNM